MDANMLLLELLVQGILEHPAEFVGESPRGSPVNKVMGL